MGALANLRRRVGNAIKGPTPAPENLRQWDAAKTHRLNSAHWTSATGAHINDTLDTYGLTVSDRAAHELSINAMLQGVVQTHVVDVVGAHGPQLQVVSDSPAYNEELEGVVGEWAEDCDATGQLALADCVSLWVRQLWPYGEYLFQAITDDVDTLVELRLNNINPRRLNNPLGTPFDPNITLGIRRNKYGRPVTYYVAPPDDRYIVRFGEYDEIPAKDMVHGFIREQANQCRGVPWIAAALQSIADLHDLDHQIMDAMRAAADNGVFLYTDHPDAEFISVNESTTIERGTVKTAPPGWKPSQLDPKQPGTNTIGYRDERMREAGAAANMPLLKIKRDASGHNYSSARFDASAYYRGNDWLRATIERTALRRLVRAVAREAGLAAGVNKAPSRVKLMWRWPPNPHVDPVKEADAERIALESKTISLYDAVVARGKDYEQHQKELRDQAKFESEIGPKEETNPEAKVARALGAYVDGIVAKYMNDMEAAPNANGKPHAPV